MQPFVSSALRYRWWLGAIVLLVWGAGLIAAYSEYKSTYESRATIWVLRPSPDLSVTNPEDPSVPIIQTGATQQVELLNQLLQTRSFVRDVVARTSLAPALDGASSESAALDDVRRRFHVQTLGTNMLSVSFTGRDPYVPAEMVTAALEIRAERVAKARIDSTSALSTLYQREFSLAQRKARDAQRELDGFLENHPLPVSDSDAHERDQLRLILNLAQARVSDLQGRMDRAVLAPALVDVSGMEFQVVDQPRVERKPSGGLKPAGTIAGIAFASGAALACLLVLVGALLASHVAGPADIAKLGSATLSASIARVVVPRRGAGGARASLVALALAETRPTVKSGG